MAKGKFELAKPIKKGEVKWLIESLGLTQAKFGQIHDVSITTVNRWVNGHPPSTLWQLKLRDMIDEETARQKK